MARRFRFSLKPVLRLREITEGQKKKDFALANREVEEERMRRRVMQDDREKTQESVREVYAAGGDFEQIVDMYRYINSLDLQLAASSRKLADLNKVLDQKRQALVAAQKDRKALELLQDKRRDAYMRECARQQQIELDALSVQARQHHERKG